MDCCNTTGLPSVEDAMALILRHCSVLSESENVTLEQLNGRIAAQDISATLQIPQYDNSAMDGYAIRFEDSLLDKPLTVVGQSFAGEPFDGTVLQDQCVRIMTGAMLPDGADTVIKQEDVVVQQQLVHLRRKPHKHEAIRRAGEDMQVGETLLTKGTLLTPFHIGLLAASGYHEIPVTRKLKVAIMSTGNELVDAPGPISPQQIYDSNRPAVKAMLQTHSMLDIIDFGIVPDGKEQLTATLLEANELADVVITSGGVSVGEADYTKEVLQELGQIHLWKIAIKPGKPLAFGHLSDSLFFGLPGNPVSAVVTLQQIVIKALFKLCGKPKSQALRLTATAIAPIKKRSGRTDFQRGIFTQGEDGEISVMPLSHQGSGVFSSMAKANCFIVLPQDAGDIPGNQKVTIEPFSVLQCQ